MTRNHVDHKIAELFVDICVYNSCILWKKLNPDEGQVDHLRFRKQLINELIPFHSYGATKQNKTGKKNSAENPLHLTDRHFPRTYPKSGKKSSPQIRCVRCHSQGKRKDTRFWCVDCGVGLCLNKCVEDYHTLRDYTLDSDKVSK